MRKKVLFLCTLYIASLCLILTGCKTNEPEQPAKVQTYHVSIQAGKGDANQQNGPRKALGLNGTTLTASWKTGERVSVRNVTKGTDLTGYLEAESNGVQTMLSGDLTGTINAGDELLLRFLSPDYTNQQGTIAYIEEHCDYAEATIHVASVTWGSITFQESIADFHNRQAIAKFTLKNKATDAALAASDLKVEVDNRSFNIHVDPATSEIFVALPGFTDKTIKLTATVGSDTYTYTSPSAKTFEDGKYYTITVGMSKKVFGFSIDDTHQIEFAHGNLQYKHTPEPKWRIATNQYDFVGSYWEVHTFANCLWYDVPAIGNVYEGGIKCNNADPTTTVMSTNCWIDLFGWNTWDKPLLISDNMADYAIGQSSFTDWGANEIYDGDVKCPVNYWRTLTNDEWNYILNGRDNADHLCCTASITSDYGDVKGLILLPDGFVKPDDITFHYITDPTSNYPMTLSPNKDYSGASGYPNMVLTLNPKTDENFHITLANALNADNYVYNQNRYTKSQWVKMEAAGAVFLPVAGWMQVRYNDNNDHSKGVWALHRFANFIGGYWSSSLSSSEAFYLMLTHEQGKVGFGTEPFCNGQAVRLVHNLY
jgi:hypothetical protein